MKKLIISLIMAASMATSAHAADYHDAGKVFAQIKACHFAGKITKNEKTLADLNILKHYNVAGRTDWWRKQMQNSRMKQFTELNGSGNFKVNVMCAILKEKWV